MFQCLRRSPKRTVVRFLEAMNARDFEMVELLLADDFCLIDNTGNILKGREDCLAVLSGFAKAAPDYTIISYSLVERGNDILISGQVQGNGTEIGNSAQWRASADRSRMHKWQSYGYGRSISMIAELHQADS
ncbi:MAG: nuclear transport factor 2 family protein [Alteraurantiacibacter sp.]